MTPAGWRDSLRAGAAAWALMFALAIIAGAWLRWYQLGVQVLLDDEWHAVHKVLHSDAAGIATTFGFADHSIPLTLYYRLLALHGGLTEWVMRLPMLLSGIGLLLVVPLLLRRETTLPVRAAWVTLLAISPLLVYHSKTARPYALTSLLTFIAIVAFRRWWLREGATKGWGAAYIAASFLAGWLHPITLPFTLLPFAYYGVRALFIARTGAGGLSTAHALRRLLTLGILASIPLAAALLPPLLSDWVRFSAKAGAHWVTPESFLRTLLMLFGIARPALLVILAALTGLGIHQLWQRDRDLTGYLATLTLAAAIAIAAAGPQWIHHPAVYARYLLPGLPFLLLFVAEGAVACLERLRRSPVQAFVLAVCAALLWWAGPMPDYLYRPNQFMGHLRFQYDYDPAHNPYVREIPRDPIPAFYSELAQRPPRTLTLIEAPWRLESNFNPHPWYQEIHRQYVKIGLTTPVCGVREFGEYPATVT
ncbi:MAG TPA: hypothetical protein VGK75_12560, partial [Casimicrobiaceae bacterium]